LPLCPVEMRRAFRSRCQPMTDRRGSDAAQALPSPEADGKTCTSAAKTARFFRLYVVAKATTYKNFHTLSPHLATPLLALINPELQLRSTENYSLHEREPAR
jgi:hypothetical protein